MTNEERIATLEDSNHRLGEENYILTGRIAELEAKLAEANARAGDGQLFYCVIGNEDNCACWWSLGPTEEDSWRFFANGCVDAEPITRAKKDGARCVRVRLVIAARPAESEGECGDG